MQSQNGDVELSVTLSTKGLQSDAQKIKRDIEKEFKSSLVFKPTIDDKALQQELNRVNRNNKNTIELTPDVDKNKLEQVNKLFQRITGIDEAAGWDASTDSINNYLSAYLHLSNAEMDAHRQWVADNASIIQSNENAANSVKAIQDALSQIDAPTITLGDNVVVEPNAIQESVDEATEDVRAIIPSSVSINSDEVAQTITDTETVIYPGVQIDEDAVQESLNETNPSLDLSKGIFIEPNGIDEALASAEPTLNLDSVVVDPDSVQSALDSIQATLNVVLNIENMPDGALSKVADEITDPLVKEFYEKIKARSTEFTQAGAWDQNAAASNLNDAISSALSTLNDKQLESLSRLDADVAKRIRDYQNIVKVVQQSNEKLQGSAKTELEKLQELAEEEELVKQAEERRITTEEKRVEAEQAYVDSLLEQKQAIEEQEQALAGQTDTLQTNTEELNNGLLTLEQIKGKLEIIDALEEEGTPFDRTSEEAKLLEASIDNLTDKEFEMLKQFMHFGDASEEAGDKASSSLEITSKNIVGYTEKMEQLKAEAEATYEELQKMKDGFEYSGQYKETLELVEKMEKDIRLTNKELEFMFQHGQANTDKFREMQENVKSMEFTLKGAQAELARMEEEGAKWEIGVDEEAIARTEQKYDALINKQTLLNQAVRMGSGAWNELEPNERIVAFVENLKLGFAGIGNIIKEQVLPKVKQFAANMLKAVGSGVRRGLSAIAKGFQTIKEKVKGISQRFKETAKHAGQAFNFRQILAYALGIRGLFSVISKLRQAITEGVKNVAQWNNGNNKTNESISMLMSSLAQMKNALGSAFAPIITVVAPLLNQLIDLVTQATNAIAQFIAMISGQSTWLKAKKNAQDYAKSLGGVGGAADKASGKLAAFDDLNVLGKDDKGGGGGGGGISPNDMFEEVSVEPWVTEWLDKLKEMWENADFTELGAIVGEWLKNALDSIPWDKIKEVVAKIARSIATFLNGFFETEGLGASIGNTIAEALNTAFLFVYEFASTLHWDSIGKFIGEGLLAFLDTIDAELIGNAIAEVIKGGIDLAYNLVTTFLDGGGFKTLGTKISTIINTFFENMGTIDPEVGLNAWQKLGETFSNTISGLLTTITTAIEETDWSQIGQSLADIISGIDWDILGMDFTNFVDALAQGLIDAIDSLPVEDLGAGIMEFIENVDWNSLGTDLSDFADSLFKAIYNAIKSIDWVEVGEAIGDFLAGIDWLTLLGDVAAIIFAALGAALKVIWGALKSIGADIIEGIWEGIKGIGSWLEDQWNIFWTLGPIAWFKNLFGIASPSKLFADFGVMLIQGLVNGIKSVVQGLYDLWTTIKDTVINTVQALWDGVVALWNGLWNGITTIVNGIWTTITTIWNGIKDTVEDVITKLWGRITATWTKVHDDVVFWWGKVKHEVVSKVLEIKTNVENKVAELRDKVVEKWEALREKTAEKFKKIKDAIVKAWEGVKEGIKKPINGILSFIEGMINKIIDGLNWFIEKLNSIKMEVTNPWDSSQKYTLGFDLEPLENISIPRLAQGAVIPPNKQFLAMLGDQKYGTNIEAPLDTIKEAFADVVGNLNVQNTGNAVMQVDGKTFARLMTPYVVSELERRGYNVAVMEA